MDSDYGRKISTISTFPFVSMGQLFIGIILFAVGIGTMISGLKGSGKLVIPILLIVAGLLFLVYSIMQMVVCKVTLFENGIHIRTIFKSFFIKRDEIYAIYWEREGEVNPISSKAPKRNQSCADIIMKGGKTAFKMSSGFYRDLDKILGAYQDNYKISRKV